MRTSWIFLVLVTLVACDCGKKEQAPVAYEPLKQLAPPPEPAAPRMADDQCKALLTEADLEEVCGVSVPRARGGKEGACIRRFKLKEGERQRSLALGVEAHNGGEALAEAFNGRKRKAAEREGFRDVQNIGIGAFASSVTKGKKGQRRSGPALDFAVGDYIAQLRAPHDEGAQPLCTADKLEVLAKRIGERLGTAAAAAPAAAKDPGKPAADEPSAADPSDQGDQGNDEADDEEDEEGEGAEDEAP